MILETSKAISDREVRSTAYPIQRLRSIELQVPSRVVNQSVLPVTVVPVWPSGADELNPLMVCRVRVSFDAGSSDFSGCSVD